MGTNTGIGIGIGIPFKNNALGGDKPYFPPELKARMIGVWTNYGKKNTDADRNIIKNKIPNAGGDLEILNAAYEGMSGYNGYPVIFGINKTWKNVPTYNSIYSINGNKIHITKVLSANKGLIFNYVKQNDQLYDITEIPSFKIRVSGLKGDSKLRYSYIKTENAVYQTLLDLDNGIHKLPKSLRPTDSIINESWIGFTITPIVENETTFDCDITIEVLPEYEGAFVTDGINDMIISQKTLQEMGVTKELTIVSMIHQISFRNFVSIPLTNYIRNGDTFIRNSISNIGKTGIYGYTCFNIKNVNYSASKVINNILGDKNDYIVEYKGDILSERFSVQGYIDDNSNILETSSVAHYWTFAVLGKATEDDINLIIGYFNLDRTLKPDILCNTIKQGITNENHAEFDDKLIDFSGNGRDIQLNNIAWKGDSGIGKYEVDFLDSSIWASSNSAITSSKIDCKNAITHIMLLYYNVGGKEYPDIPSFKIIKTGADIDYSYINETGFPKSVRIVDGVNVLPASHNTLYSGSGRFCGFGNPGIGNSVTITQIPSHAGALCLDGVNDFGQFVGDLGLKDYTLIMNRAYNNLINNQVPLVSSNIVEDQTPFIVEHWNTGSNAISFSYGASRTTDIPLDINKKIVYQSTYSYMGYVIPKGNAISTGNGITLGKFGNGVQYSAICLWSLMLFPYSMSEFLIERQLKKHKLGTLYPDMVEFRPIIKANANYKITYYQIDSTNTWKSIKVGDYIVIGAKLAFQITFDNDASELKEVVSPQLSGIIVQKRPSNLGYNIYSYITSKSPQKINITIDEYIRFEDIVQPYPVLLRFKDENGNEVSWGGKFKVGSTITRIGSAADSNLLPNIYNIFGLLLNGNQVTSSKVIVEKTMVFKAKSAYIFDNNEPKCILSPRLLRIPNSSYKILGHIPDISGHGNHGKINNSAYAEGSGVNEDGSYQLDGVDDFVTIPTIVGGKQVLMKVNWNTINSIIYDQRGSGGFAIYCSDYNNPSDSITVPAYKGRNTDGTTYIDGIRNEYIIASQLRNVTHNIVEILDTSYAAGDINPIIGKSYMNSNYGSLALYDFMLFDDISTDDKILELNEYVGIEAKVELPPYYWDAYGKSNLDEDRDSIKQRGVAVGDYDLTNTNFAYDKVSGFGGYEFTKFDNTSEWTNRNRKDGIEIIKKNGYSFTAKRIGTGQYFYDFQNRSTTVLNKSLTVKAVSNNNTCIRWEYKYRTAEKPDIDSTLLLVRQAMIPNVPITVALPYKTEQEKADLGVTEGSDSYLFYFDPSDIPVGEEYTVEMLPLYPNGLLYDAVTDYSENVNIPVFTDFTAIMKRKWLKNQGCPLIKGSKVYEGGNGNALLFEWDKAYNFVFYKRTDIMEGEVLENISFITPTNYNGNVITRGSEQDTNGICIAGDGNAGFANIVFYKLILYPKTIPLLQINFLKNLMERDEIIDLNNPIFIKNE